MVDAALQKDLRVRVYEFSKEYLPVRSSTPVRDGDEIRLRPKNLALGASERVSPEVQVRGIYAQDE